MKLRNLGLPLSALALCGAWSPAQALQLGGLHVESRLGEPLSARIDLLVGLRDPLERARVQVLADRMLPPGVAVQGHLERTADGGAQVVLSSTGAVIEPLFAVRLRIEMPGVAIRRTYDVLMSGSAATGFSIPPVVPVGSAAPGGPRSPASADRSGRHWTVQPGQTLWQIAASVRPDASHGMHETMAAIHQANPQAFIGGDMNRLKAGAVLALPGFDAQAPGARASVVVEHAPEPAEPAQPAITAATPLAPAAPAAGVSAPTAPAAAATAPADDPARLAAAPADPRLQAELAAIDDRLAAARAFIAARATGSPAIAAAAAATTDARFAAPAPAAPNPAPPAVEPALNADPQAGGTPGSEAAPLAARPAPPAVAPAQEADPSASPPVNASALVQRGMAAWLGFVLTALILAALALYTLRRLRTRVTTTHREADHRAAERARLAAVAEKVASRERAMARASGKVVPIGRRADSHNGSVRGMPDPLAEADLNLAYGRYAEAEAALQQIIDDSPHNHRARLKLAEVYHAAGRGEAFVQVVEELDEDHHDLIRAEDWQRLLEMGRAVAPQHPLFAGSRAAGHDAIPRR